MRYQRINYSALNSRQKEIYNFQKVAAELADFGFNCIKLADDWQGADFLAYHLDGVTTLRVQLKGRLTIDRKYLTKSLHIAFPYSDAWYLVPHDELVELVGHHCNWLNTSSWQEKGHYSSKSPSQALLGALSHFRIGQD